MSENIKITNISAEVVEIDIEGIIGMSEAEDNKTQSNQVATYDEFKARIKQIADIKKSSVVVNIRSTGGDVNDALLIHDALKALPSTITTRCYGYVASAATIIAQAASKGRREISSNALYLIHKATSSTEGNINTIVQMADLLDKTDQRIASIYATRSGKPIDNFVELMNENNGNGRWLAPKEAMEAGLVDRIIESAPISNSTTQMIERLKLPQIPTETDQNQTSMKTSKRWQSILAILGFAPAQQTPLSESNLDSIESELETRSSKIADLQNKIVTLEDENARLAAKATQTKPKEDPSLAEYKRSANEEAYNNDVSKFR